MLITRQIKCSAPNCNSRKKISFDEKVQEEQIVYMCIKHLHEYQNNLKEVEREIMSSEELRNAFRNGIDTGMKQAYDDLMKMKKDD